MQVSKVINLLNCHAGNCCQERIAIIELLPYKDKFVFSAFHKDLHATVLYKEA